MIVRSLSLVRQLLPLNLSFAPTRQLRVPSSSSSSSSSLSSLSSSSLSSLSSCSSRLLLLHTHLKTPLIPHRQVTTTTTTRACSFATLSATHRHSRTTTTTTTTTTHNMVTKRTTASSTRSSSRLTAKTDAPDTNVTVEKVPVTSSTAVTTTTTPKSAKRATTQDDDEADEEEDTASTEDKEDGDYAGGAAKKQKKTPAATTKTASPPALKKQKSAPKVPIRANSHTNTTMPDPLVLPKTPDGCVKITSWNVSGLNSSLKKGFKTYITAEDADVICIQEHKVQQPLLNLVDPKVYPFSWWGFEEKKGYAGVAMFCKTKPISITAGLPTHPNPACTKGRIVTLEYPTCFILGCYVPNAGQGLVRLKERMVWDKAMKAWLLDLKSKGKQIIWTGDLNVCHLPIDLRNPASNTTSAGFTPEERAGFSAILEEVDLVDTFREIQGTGEEAEGQYSYFSYRFQCRVKGIGWRLDYFVTDKQMYKERLVESVIREECYGASDHVPVVLVIKGEL